MASAKMHRPKKSRHVALIYDARLPYDVKVMTGVAAYLQSSGAEWSIYTEENALNQQRLPDLRAWHGDGILADFDDARVASQVLASGIPTVAFGSGFGWHDPKSGIPYFYSDNEAVGRLVAEHLLQNGFRHFAFYGYAPGAITGFSSQRAESFARHVRSAGGYLHQMAGPYERLQSWEALQNSTLSWLKSLPKPIGLMAANDKAARRVLDACRSGSIRVPEEIAVVGVDNDEMLCRLCTPPLSSVELGARQIGFKAAALLDRIMSGRGPGPRRSFVPPEGLVTRRSSDVVAVDDPEIAAALVLIRDRACHGLKVYDLERAVPLSRSQLNRRFKSVVGRTLHEQIRSVRVEQAKRLLADTALPLKQLAGRCGFRTVQHLTDTFRRSLGVSPGAYRRERMLARLS